VRFWLRRVGGLLLVLFLLSVVVFLIFNVIPGGDPAVRLAGRHPTAANIAAIRHDWGFDRPLWVQYADMMDRVLIKHDSISYQDQTQVLPTIGRGIPRTASLAVGAAVIWLLFGVLFGVISGLTAGRWPDRVFTVLAMAGISTPIFWLGAVLLYLLTFKWHSSPLFHWLPSGGYVNFTTDPLQWAAHLLLPWLCLSVVSIGFYSRRRVLLRHTLRTSLIPLTSLFALDFGAAIGGTVILIEPVFGINGIGEYAQQSVAHLDLPPLMALTLYGGFFIVIVNAIADVVFTFLDPRIVLD
jgi:peptide/nickel transport system permease protein